MAAPFYTAGSTMNHKDMAYLVDEINALLREVEKLPTSQQKNIVQSCAELVRDIVDEEAGRMVDSLLRRRSKGSAS